MMNEPHMPSDVEQRMITIHQLHMAEIQTQTLKKVVELEKSLSLAWLAIVGITVLGCAVYYNLDERVKHEQDRPCTQTQGY